MLDQQGRRRRWARLLFIIPLVALLWVPFYSSGSPELFGFPYFYWYQLLWIIFTSLITAGVYLFETRR
ncbi:uncharacterized protein DUF3311 [Thermosporothrix hazakensis]|jgi:hypothetical protein|uniref:Uncharacterized protein DUF3311 n=2 Tax=Thermosporothrix TaxID=768650 RepID=A0A326UHH5_THEHA|nr:DUF3311 domain-containing protein [Thermosporothrix hazakensis]PZW36320.1 uncharacterized protein DUF3311 [Thermosporothrix hazakensis]BBH88786.1 hypothetical protein KTC_35370 [Thermosporothrix sp. COM3]GCE46969.1 hypothetical protein KTH_18380 [Thermosporothrix hazakensis]